MLLRCGKFYHFLLLPMLVKELAERYGLKSTKAIYDRLSALDITLPKKNRKSYATNEIVEKLDELQEHLDNGGTLIEGSLIGACLFL